MNSTNRQIEFGLLFECIRKMNNWEQVTVAKMIGSSQARVSKIENGMAEISVFEWSEFAQKAQLSLDVIKNGYLDQKINVEIRSDKKENNYNIPDLYRSNRCINTRFFLQTLIYVQDKFGREKFLKFLSEKKIPQSFFYCMDNQLNLNFYADLLIFFKIKPEDYAKISVYNGIPKLHGDLSHGYLLLKNRVDLIKAYLKSSAKYQKIFDVEFVEEKSNHLVVKYQITKTIKDSFFKTDDFFIKFIDSILGDNLIHFSELIKRNGVAVPPLSITEKHGSFLKGDHSLVFKIN